jgi:hypothetical protein
LLLGKAGLFACNSRRQEAHYFRAFGEKLKSCGARIFDGKSSLDFWRVVPIIGLWRMRSNVNVNCHFALSPSRIPPGFHQLAQGWRPAPTLGIAPTISLPQRGCITGIKICLRRVFKRLGGRARPRAQFDAPPRRTLRANLKVSIFLHKLLLWQSVLALAQYSAIQTPGLESGGNEFPLSRSRDFPQQNRTWNP